MDEGLKSQAAPQAARQALSALLDGEHERHELSMVCQAWRDDAELRQTWHTYSVIGDVLRSDDLAHEADRDAAFLARLRSRMAEEPVILAPVVSPAQDAEPSAPMPLTARASALSPAMPLRRNWGAPLAMAAGVVTVVGVAVMMRGLAPTTAAPTLAAAGAASGVVAVVARDMAASGLSEAPILVRNPDLDRYLNAHRQYGGAGVIGTPGGFRQVAASPADR